MTGSGPQWEIEDKLRKIRQISLQIDELFDKLEINERGHYKFTPAQALDLQELQQRRCELRATLPPIKIVVDNG